MRIQQLQEILKVHQPQVHIKDMEQLKNLSTKGNPPGQSAEN